VEIVARPGVRRVGDHGFDRRLRIGAERIETEDAALLVDIDLAVRSAHDHMGHVKIGEYGRDEGRLAALRRDTENLAARAVPFAHIGEQEILSTRQR
jgi:hypothetical protein